ncbi:monovalent cation/H(+) antiporter subunit G [Mangrovibrevibacter kandeliae]|uniref:monovalent cation/H(+) antiporter subunit G n=1 Tax=Mangrovibrevibacter kandeliae TaxID=2968473 RepID=UPI0021184E8B|nr:MULTISPECIES: monovalent cation/H(+) antiporter subunit G [unclassified Aurantimonas]MCQ8780875.1 monovalent cation/H(+) antiporter subunit G [Aurantimonas sp. CSK15Z-1]MCW4113655.1 monovalent cation/H(+) antiporter subunit G [Aurantimonas sp. MSK8Z-1]
MTAVFQILVGLLILCGSAFAAVAALGVLRLPDLYSRMHAASKAGAVGSSIMLIALMLATDQPSEVLRAIGAIIFFLLTAPISAHLLARAAYLVGYPMWKGSVLDEMPDTARKKHYGPDLQGAKVSQSATDLGAT